MIGWLLAAHADAFQVAAAAFRFLLYATALFTGGLALFLALFGARLRPEDRAAFGRGVRLAAALGLGAVALWFASQVTLAEGDWPMDAELWWMLAGLPPGWSAGVAAAGFAALAVAGGGAGVAGVAGLALLLVSFALVGHTAAHPARALLAPTLVLHLVAAAFWAGSLWPLTRVARGRPRDAAPLIAAWTRWAAWLVAALAVSGAALAWAIVGSVAALVGTRYGWALLGKVALVGVLLAFAAWHRFRLTPALERDEPGAGARLAASIRAEAAVMTGVVWMVSEMTATSPTE